MNKTWYWEESRSTVEYIAENTQARVHSREYMAKNTWLRIHRQAYIGENKSSRIYSREYIGESKSSTIHRRELIVHNTQSEIHRLEYMDETTQPRKQDRIQHKFLDFDQSSQACQHPSPSLLYTTHAFLPPPLSHNHGFVCLIDSVASLNVQGLSS